MNATEGAAIAHYLGKPLSKDVACGIVAVLCAESNLNPGSQGSQSTEHGGALNPNGAFGLASWNGPRQQDLVNFAARKGLNPTLINTQLDFVLTEAANSYPLFWNAIKSPSTSTYADVIEVMVDTYEIPADKPAEIARAMIFAQDFYSQLIPVPTPIPVPIPTPTPTPTPTPSPTPFNPVQVAFITKIVLAVAQAMAEGGMTFPEGGS